MVKPRLWWTFPGFAVAAVAAHVAARRYLPHLTASIISDLRKEFVPQMYRDFELLVEQPAVPYLTDMIDDWYRTRGDSYALRHIRRYIAGFGTLDGPAADLCFTSVASPWIFLPASKKFRDSDRAFEFALRRSIERRFLQTGIPRNWLTRRSHIDRSTRLAAQLLRHETI